LWKIERSRDESPEALKNMVRHGLDAMVGAVEKALYGVGDGLAKEQKEKEQREDDKRWRSVRDNEVKEERRRKEEEKVRKLEEKLERVMRENEDKWRERDERLRDMEDRMEREAGRKAGEAKRTNDQTKTMEAETWESEIEDAKERITALEDRFRDGGKTLGEGDSEVRVRVDKLEKDMAKERAERQELELNVEGEKVIQEAKESEEDMERRLEGAMDQVKILNLDFGKECGERRTLVKEAVSRIKEKVTEEDREDFEKIMKGARIDILGKSTITKESGKGRIHTVPILITCGCKNAKERLEVIVRKAGLVASFQWPKECMEFVDRIREKVETMGFGRKEYYARVRPVVKDGRVLLRADTKRKEGGIFKGLAYWRAPPINKEYWTRITGLVEPEWLIAK
jgi:hypothetical protein